MKAHIPLQLMVFCISAVGACQKGKYPPLESNTNEQHWVYISKPTKYIELNSAFELNIQNGSTDRIATSNIVNLTWRNDTLNISHDFGNKKVKVYLELAQLLSLKNNAGGQILCNLNQLNDTVVMALVGGEHHIHAGFKSLQLQLQSGSLTIRGEVNEFKSLTRFGSHLMAFELKSQFTHAFAETCSKQYLIAPHYLNASSCDSSEIGYKGNPSTELLSTCNGGIIKHL